MKFHSQAAGTMLIVAALRLEMVFVRMEKLAGKIRDIYSHEGMTYGRTAASFRYSHSAIVFRSPFTLIS